MLSSNPAIFFAAELVFEEKLGFWLFGSSLFDDRDAARLSTTCAGARVDSTRYDKLMFSQSFTMGK